MDQNIGTKSAVESTGDFPVNEALTVDWYEKFGAELLRFCRSRLWRDDGDDVFQDICLKIHRSRSRFHGGNARAWIYQIARTTIIDYQRKKKPEFNSERVSECADQAAGLEAVELLIDEEQSRKLQSCIESLKEDHRQVFHLIAQGLSYQQISESLGIETGTVGSRKNRMIKSLNECVQE